MSAYDPIVVEYLAVFALAKIRVLRSTFGPDNAEVCDIPN